LKKKKQIKKISVMRVEIKKKTRGDRISERELFD
jgi:hypothetical protein